MRQPRGSGLDGANSSTDASSLSRNSMFEQACEPSGESARTSFEHEDSSGLPGDETTRLKRRVTTPTRHHGRPLSVRTPQTVSFADFGPSVASPTRLVRRPSGSSMHSLTRGVGRSSDGHKPLPPIPGEKALAVGDPPRLNNSVPAVSSPDDSPGYSVGALSGSGSNKAPHHDNKQAVQDPQAMARSPSLRKTPPAPPLSRRHSLRVASQSAGRIDLSVLSLDGASINTQAAGSTSTSSLVSAKSPPPPPPRRSGTVKSRTAKEARTQAEAAARDPPMLPPDSVLSSQSANHTCQENQAVSSVGLSTPSQGVPLRQENVGLLRINVDCSPAVIGPRTPRSPSPYSIDSAEDDTCETQKLVTQTPRDSSASPTLPKLQDRPDD